LVGSFSVVEASSSVIARAGDSGCPKVAEEGNDVGLRNSRRRRWTHARDTVACVSGTRPSLGPSTHARQSSLHTVRVKPPVVGRCRRHRGWANSRKRDEPAPGSAKRTERGSPPITARKSGVMGKKRKMVEAIVPARKRGPRFGCPHVDKAVAEVIRRRLTSNKLGKRAPKRAAGSSERGSSSK